MHVTGPVGTAYSQGVWRLHLKIPEDYPHSPPKAAFRTKIWHPNVDEQTGSVCVDTLKKDWTEKLTLRDVLVTISCLLVHPNPDSALNATAGSMLQADYRAFFDHAKLMTAIHAKIPVDLKHGVLEAKRRGEDPNMVVREELEQEELRPRPTKAASTSSVIFKKRPHRLAMMDSDRSISAPSVSAAATTIRNSQQENADESENDENDESEASKENDPSLSPSPVEPPVPSPRKNPFGKRPLAALPTPAEHEGEQWAYIEDDEEELSANQANIANNTNRSDRPPVRKSPKLSERLKGVNAFGRILIEEGCDNGTITPYIDDDVEPLKHTKTSIPSLSQAINEKENAAAGIEECKETSIKEKKSVISSNVPVKQAGSRMTTSTSSSASKSGKSKLKTGLRRL